MASRNSSDIKAKSIYVSKSSKKTLRKGSKRNFLAVISKKSNMGKSAKGVITKKRLKAAG